MNNPDERWLPVVGYEGSYEVSDHGRVKSVARTIMRKNGRPQKIRERILGQYRQGIAQNPNHRYLSVTLILNGEYSGFLVHRLVLEAFVGPCPAGFETCHANDMGDDNRLENLRWDTPSANRKDAVTNCTHPNSKKTHCKNDHEFTAENTRWVRRKNGRAFRVCITCNNHQQRERYHRMKAGLA